MGYPILSVELEALLPGIIYESEYGWFTRFGKDMIFDTSGYVSKPKESTVTVTTRMKIVPEWESFNVFSALMDRNILEKLEIVEVPDALLKYTNGEISAYEISVDGKPLQFVSEVIVDIHSPFEFLIADGIVYDYTWSFGVIGSAPDEIEEPSETIKPYHRQIIAETDEVLVTKIVETGETVVKVKGNTQVKDATIMSSNKTFEDDYRFMLGRCLQGEVIENPRTKVKCFTSLNHTITLTPEVFPILTSRKIPWKAAIKEMICYMRGVSTLEGFHRMGVKTWDANCNAWQPNDSNIKTHGGDCGLIYGASAIAVGFGYQDVIKTLQNPESRHDRGIIWNFWNPAYFHLGCLRPCMMMHQFNVLGDTLYLTSYQRSQDVPLGGAFNLIQAWYLLWQTAKLANLKMGTATVHISNAHIYEDQVEGVKELLDRNRKPNTAKFVAKKVPSLYDILYDMDAENFDDFFDVEDYESHGPIKFPFTV